MLEVKEKQGNELNGKNEERRGDDEGRKTALGVGKKGQMMD